MMRSALASLVFLVVAACDAEVDLIIDASGLSVREGASTLFVDLVVSGETFERFVIDVAETPVTTREDYIQIGEAYGIAAFLDRDGDRACASVEDTSWLFQYAGVYNEDFVWEVDDDTLVDPLGCGWFAGADLDED